MIQRIIARTTPESKAHVGLLMSPFANMALETNIPRDLSIFLDYIKCNSISSQLFWLSILKRPRSMGMSGVSDGWIMAFFASPVGFGAWAEEKGACLQDTSLGLLSVEDASLFSVSFSLPVVSSPCCFTKWWRWSISCLCNPSVFPHWSWRALWCKRHTIKWLGEEHSHSVYTHPRVSFHPAFFPHFIQMRNKIFQQDPWRFGLPQGRIRQSSC